MLHNSFFVFTIGKTGKKGNDGAQGPPGQTGEKGDKGNGVSGVNYVRWGRIECPGNATLVYSGMMGGENHNHQGGGANYLCLPRKPKYDKYDDGNQNSGYMFGTEYEINDYSGSVLKSNLHDHEVPCAVCFVKSRGSMLMIPAQNDCPYGWTEEYHGYLMTAYYDHANQKDYVCVDKDPDYILGTKESKDGALLYHVEGQCGSLPCLPYVNHRELTCAVCTK
ncbi:short-chain collagen C4-like [Porites lutea]|uniref:short-chain collagen C4-like n=1 Tax=Porites lutea TaxID=51062 RepID=UPI003CC62295